MVIVNPRTCGTGLGGSFVPHSLSRSYGMRDCTALAFAAVDSAAAGQPANPSHQRRDGHIRNIGGHIHKRLSKTQYEAEAFFNYKSYAIGSAIGAFLMGITTTAVAMIFIRSKNK
jgi:hypothetical protein